jgi:hypothetical protein
MLALGLRTRIDAAIERADAEFYASLRPEPEGEVNHG